MKNIGDEADEGDFIAPWMVAVGLVVGWGGGGGRQQASCLVAKQAVHGISTGTG